MNVFPKVAVVILNWNGKHWLQKFLPGVAATPYPQLQVWVADNASTDDSVEYVQQNFPAIHIFQNTTNEGFAGGYNTALKNIEADYYVLLNSDVEVVGDWVSPVIQLMESHEDIGAAQPKLLSYNDKKYFEYAGAAGGCIDVLGYPFCRGRIFDHIEDDQLQYEKPAEIFWATGSCLFVKAHLYHQLGGLDNMFFAHMEEIDFCWRLKNNGYKIYYCPDAHVYHVGGGMLHKSNPFKTKLNFRNSLFCIVKNMPRRKMWLVLILRLMLDYVTIFKNLLQRNTGDALAILDAHGEFFKSIVTMLKKRKQVKPKNSIVRRGAAGYYHKSIVWAYFINKKKIFRELNF